MPPRSIQPRRLARRLAPAQFLGPLTVVAALAAPLAACDPCAGVVACNGEPRLGVGGQIVDRGDPSDAHRAALSGATIPDTRPVRGVRVEVIPSGGVAAGAPRAAATTDDNGWWQVSIPVADVGAAAVDVVVTAPGGSSYTVRGVDVRATRRRGDGNVLGRWTHELYMTELGEVHNWPSDARPAGARVTAIRRGGIEVAPTRNTAVPMLTVGDGRFLYDVRPLGDGPVVLDFVVERDGFPTATVRNVTVYPRHEWLPPHTTNPAVLFYLDSAGARPF